jgi:hypothetical protein
MQSQSLKSINQSINQSISELMKNVLLQPVQLECEEKKMYLTQLFAYNSINQ